LVFIFSQKFTTLALGKQRKSMREKRNKAEERKRQNKKNAHEAPGGASTLPS
jgi:hypothetical protein